MPSPACTSSRLVPSASSWSSRSACEVREIPSTLTTVATPIATPEGGQRVRSRREDRPDQPTRSWSPRLTRSARWPHAGTPRRESWVTSPSRISTLRRIASATVVLVGDHHDRGAVDLVELVEQPEHLVAAVGVEVAGRLVGEDDRRPVEQRPGDRHPLPLAAAEHRGGCAARCSSPTLASISRRAPLALRPGYAGVQQALGDVVERGQPVEQVERTGTRTRSGAPAAPASSRLATSSPVSCPSTTHGARGAAVEGAHDVQQRGLAGPGRADDGHQLARVHGKVDAVQHLEVAVALPELAHLQHGSRSVMPAPRSGRPRLEARGDLDVAVGVEAGLDGHQLAALTAYGEATLGQRDQRGDRDGLSTSLRVVAGQVDGDRRGAESRPPSWGRRG